MLPLPNQLFSVAPEYKRRSPPAHLTKLLRWRRATKPPPPRRTMLARFRGRLQAASAQTRRRLTRPRQLRQIPLRGLETTFHGRAITAPVVFRGHLPAPDVQTLQVPRKQTFPRRKTRLRGPVRHQRTHLVRRTRRTQALRPTADRRRRIARARLTRLGQRSRRRRHINQRQNSPRLILKVTLKNHTANRNARSSLVWRQQPGFVRAFFRHVEF